LWWVIKWEYNPKMSQERTRFIYLAIKQLLRPLMRVLLRNGVSHSEFAEVAKQVYVDVAQHDFTLQKRKQTVSRISVLTGLNRKEVKRVIEELTDEPSLPRANNRAVKVVNGWMRDTCFLDESGGPAPLPLEGDVSFSSLVKEYSGDMPVRAVLDELLVSGAVHRDGDMIRLATRAYVPHKDELQKFSLLGRATADLLNTFDHNLQHAHEDSRLQLTVAYDNLPREVVDEFKQLSQKQAQALLVEFNKWLAERDRDTNPESVGEGRYRAGVGVYYFEESVQGVHDEKDKAKD